MNRMLRVAGQRLSLMVVCVLVGLLGLPSVAPFTDAGADFGAGQLARYNKNVNGDFLLVGNTVLACSGNNCTTNNTTNDDLNMVNSDPDGAGALFNGSTATFTIPSGSVVDAAYLYWGANLGTTRNNGADFYCSDGHAKASNTTADKASANSVKLKVGGGAYSTVSADTVYTQPTGGLAQSLPSGSSSDGLAYEGVKDVTSSFTSVAAATATTVAVANVQAMQGENCHAGWSLTVVYRFPTLNCLTGANDNAGAGANLRNDYRNVAIYDGMLRQQDGGADTTTTLSGFLTAQPGPDDLRLGVLAWEGDQFLTGDAMKVKSNLSASSTSVDPAGPSGTTNFFDSGKQTTADHNADVDANPDSGATITQGYSGGRGDGHGIDAKTQTVQVPGGTSSIDVTFTTNNDQYYPGQFALSSPLKCLLLVEKDQAVNGASVPRDNATSPAPYVKAGDVITYTMPVRVAGDVDLDSVVLSDPIPSGTTFVPGSLTVGKGQTAAGAIGALAAGGNYAPTTVTANLGTLNNLTGATCAAGDQCYAAVRFQVTVNAGVAPGTVLTNTATSAFNASGISINEISNPVTDKVGALLTISKTIAGAVAGDPSSFSFTIACNGNQIAGSPVSLANGGSVTLGVLPGATCSVTEATNSNFAATVTGAILTNGGTTTMTQDRSVAFTNTRQFAKIVVNKSAVGVAGDPVATPTFGFTVACPGVSGYPKNLGVTGSGTAETPADIPFGVNCTVTEAASPGWAQSGSQAVQPVNESVENVSFTNTRQTGSLVINKTTVGGDGTFSFAVACDGTAWDVNRTITTVGGAGQSAIVSGIPSGVSCAVTEVPQAGWTPTAAPAGAFTIAAGQQATASFTNTRQSADLVITKAISGTYTLPVSGSFDFTIDCGAAGSFSRTITASSSAGGTATVTGLPVGSSCTITEALTTGWALDGGVVGNTNGRVVVIAEQGNGATFTNRHAVGSITIAKTIDQGSGTFRFDLSCAGTPVPGSPFDITINAPATTGSAVIDNIPTGSNCVVDEDPNGSVTGDYVQVTPAANGTVTFASTGAAQTANFVDHRRVGDLVIAKAFPAKSLGDPNQVFTFQWDCGPQPRTIGLKAGQQHTVSGIPTGTSCTVSETADAGYTATYAPQGGAVTITEGTNLVTVTNTRKTGTLELRKHLVPAGDPGRFDLDIDGGTHEATGVGDNGSTGSTTLPIGVHSIAESVTAGNSAVLSEYSATIACVNTAAEASVPVTNDGNVVVGEGATIVCTFTNTRKPADLAIVKSPGSSSVLPGGTATFSITVTNNGAGTAHSVVVSDPLPAGVTFLSSQGDVCGATGTSCSIGDLAPGASTSFTVSYLVDAGTALQVIHNAATVSSPDDPTSPGDDADIPVSRLGIVKSGTPSTFSKVGDVLTYTYVVSNGGGAPLTGVTVADDKIPSASIDCNGAAAGNGQPFGLAPGASVTCTASYTVKSADVTAKQVDNIATADSAETAPVSDDWSIPLAAMTIDKVATTAGPFALGSTVNYQITVTNTGVAPLHGVHIAEAGLAAVLDPSCAARPGTAGVTLAPGATVTCTATHVITQVDFTAGSYTNVALANSDEAPDVTDSVTVETPDPAVDLAIVKTLSSSSLVVGQQATYRLSVSNKGPATATGISVVDTVPAGLSPVSAAGAGWTCTIVAPKITCTTPSALLAGATLGPITIVVSVATTATGAITNTATVSGTQVDTDPTNNTSSVTNALTAVEGTVTVQTTTTTTTSTTVAPTTTARPTTTVSTRVESAVDNGTPLATTGSSAMVLLIIAGLLMLGGAVALALRRKRGC